MINWELGECRETFGYSGARKEILSFCHFSSVSQQLTAAVVSTSIPLSLNDMTDPAASGAVKFPSVVRWKSSTLSLINPNSPAVLPLEPEQ